MKTTKGIQEARRSCCFFIIVVMTSLSLGGVAFGQNIPPVAQIFYSSDGYEYDFYPYNCYDPDGCIVKYQYTISKWDGTDYSYVGSSTCCNSGNCNSSTDSRFCLFFTCPYICYQFPEEGATYKVELRVVDDELAQSDAAPVFITIPAPGSGNINDMYVWGINPKIKSTGSGSTLSLTVTVQHDSNVNGLPDRIDSPVQGASVHMILSKDADDLPDGNYDTWGSDRWKGWATTNRDGQAVFVIRGLPPGDYKTYVDDLTHPPKYPSYDWNRGLDMMNPHYVTIW